MAKPERRWHRRALHALGHSLRVRLVALFLLLALALAATFIFGMQKALSVGWREAARPLVSDYVDRLVVEIGSPPSVERAQALTQRLPVSVHISGPAVNWRSDTQANVMARYRVNTRIGRTTSRVCCHVRRQMATALIWASA